MDIVLPILITAVGSTFWLWSRGGKITKWPSELDEMEQALNAPLAGPFLWFIGTGLTVYGLYRSYRVSWILVIVSFFVGAFVGKIIYILLLRQFVEGRK